KKQLEWALNTTIDEALVYATADPDLAVKELRTVARRARELNSSRRYEIRLRAMMAAGNILRDHGQPAQRGEARRIFAHLKRAYQEFDEPLYVAQSTLYLAATNEMANRLPAAAHQYAIARVIAESLHLQNFARRVQIRESTVATKEGDLATAQSALGRLRDDAAHSGDASLFIATSSKLAISLMRGNRLDEAASVLSSLDQQATRTPLQRVQLRIVLLDLRLAMRDRIGIEAEFADVASLVDAYHFRHQAEYLGRLRQRIDLP
ncbi:hypothetical protein, partial [Pseudofrankia asymbiotica]|uniref:hypothetical protein n=1 Tax=Pseudofrankia asymbiotica TaxID=1834516 RepID=UPI001304451C